MSITLRMWHAMDSLTLKTGNQACSLSGWSLGVQADCCGLQLKGAKTVTGFVNYGMEPEDKECMCGHFCDGFLNSFQAWLRAHLVWRFR